MQTDELKPCPFCGGGAERRANPTFGDMSMVRCRSCGAEAYDRKWNTRSDGSNGARQLPFDRDTLGKFVREAWVRWAHTQPSPKPSWLVPYDELPEADKEADRQIGEAVARWTLIGDAALTAALSDEQTQAAKPVAHLVWLQGRRGADDVEDYYQVARPGDKCVDGSDAFPVYADPVRSAIVPAQDEADNLTDDVIAAICAAVVLGEGENYEPIHLEPREARQAIAAYHAALSPRTVSTCEDKGDSAIISKGCAE